MRKYMVSILFITGSLFLIIMNQKIYGQSAAKIENIKFDAEGSKLAITYDIVKYKEGETFEIWVKIVTASGKTLVPLRLSEYSCPGRNSEHATPHCSS